MKSICKNIIFVLLIVFFVGINNVCADLTDHSGGSSGNVSTLTAKDAEWDWDSTGIKVVIVRYNAKTKKYYEEDAELILHQNVGNNVELKFPTNNSSKIFQSNNIKWQNAKKPTNYPRTTLIPARWKEGNTTINLYDKLTNNNYSKLKSILNLTNKEGKKLFPSLKSEDYIIVEPMTRISGYFGTAYELGNAFLDDEDFFDKYAGVVFGGNMLSSKKDRQCGGFLFNTLYLENNIPNLGINKYSNPDDCTTKKPSNNKKKEIRANRNNCLISKDCGRGIGIFEFNSLYTASIEITKYQEGTKTPISNTGFTLYSDSSCKTVFEGEKKTNSFGKVIFSNLKEGNYYYKETSVPEGYKGDANCNKISVTDGKKSSKTVYNAQNPITGNLAINIKIKGTNTLITSSNATFAIYSGTNCKGTLVSEVSTLMGSKTIELNAGTYSIKEKTAPSGYAKSNAACVKSNTSITAGKTTTEDIFYEPTCTTELNNLGANPTKEQLFTLYKKYPNFRNLLNLTNPSCTVSNCKDNSLLLNCLDASTNISQFTQDNLACYNGEPLTDASGNYIGFCQTSYKLTNNLGTNKFYGKSGRLLITQSENIITIFQKNDLGKIIEKIIESKYIATASTSKVCYTLNQLNTENINALPQYNVYFGDNNNDNIADALPSEETSSPVAHSYTTNGFNMYTLNKINNYTLNSLYLERISGKYSSIKTNSTINEPIYGILSRFDKENGIILFKVEDNVSNSCSFETKKEIIKDGIDLEFRIIDTKEPFNRNTMSNWSDGEDNRKDNDKVKKYIKESVNSYGLDQYGNKANPIYKITLTPNDIKIIREDNKLHHYDDYLAEEVSYKGNKVIRNSFLYSLEKGKLNGKNLSNKLYNSKYPN